MKNKSIRLGTIWRLNDQYSNNYNYAIVTYDFIAQETIVELFSNWSSSYNTVDRIKHSDPLDVIKQYCA